MEEELPVLLGHGGGVTCAARHGGGVTCAARHGGGVTCAARSWRSSYLSC